jgi:hypothetical protein
VPALVFDIGPPVWLPSTLARTMDRRERRRFDVEEEREEEERERAAAPL